MQNKLSYRLGVLIYKCRWFMIALWVAFVFVCIPFLPDLTTPFRGTGFFSEQSKSHEIGQYIDKNLGFNSYNETIVIFHSKKHLATSKIFNTKIEQSLAGLQKLPIPSELILPKNNASQISKDKHTAYAVIIFKTEDHISGKFIDQLEKTIKTPKDMSVLLGGHAIFDDKVNDQTQVDLYKADFIAAPLALLTLIIVFGTFTAALIPISMGGMAAVLILTTLYMIGQMVTLSVFTLNIALLLGLCLSLDYSLFIVSRFREELQKNQAICEAVAATQATAGKAIFYSGLTVFASISALLFFPVNILFSLAIGGLVAVFMAVLIATTLLPALLGVLNHKVNTLPLRFSRRTNTNKSPFWHWLASKITHRPLTIFFPVFFIILLLGYPLLTVKFGVSDYKILPKNSENRIFFDVFANTFGENQLSPIKVVVQTKDNVLSKNNLEKLYTLVEKIKKGPHVANVNSIVSLNPAFGKNDYYYLYHQTKQSREIKTLLETSTGKNFTVINVVSQFSPHSKKTRQLINYLNDMTPPPGITISLTGTPVQYIDLLETISKQLPFALIWIMISTYLILLFLLRSLFLPLKAIVMNILSLSACYGALVFIFQDGYFHQLFNFQPQGMLDISLVVIIFCAIFGFSMDYEVFLLTRIREYYDKYKDTKKSIVFGIEKSSRVITSAAIIVICICSSFLVADVLMVKAFGLGIAVAISVDAFLIRSLLVPSTMTLLNRWNWYLPNWLDKCLPRA